MTGEDLTSSRLAPPPLTPLCAEALTQTALVDLGRRIAARTWADGLPDFFWGEGVCLVGMVRFARACGEPVPARVRSWLAEHASAPSLGHVNNVAPGTAAVLEGSRGSMQVAERLLAWLRGPGALTRDPTGAIEHWPGGVWADTVYMAGLFLGHLGVARRDARLVAELGEQWLAHAEVLQDHATSLFVHGSHDGVAIRSFWGRANAWMALSAVEFLEIAATHPDLVDVGAVEAVRTRLTAQLTALARLQPDHGVWSVLVDEQPENAGILETSAAAGIGAAMLRAGQVVAGLDPQVTQAGWKAIAGALAYVDQDGHLTRVSAGTVLQLIPFGYSVIRDDRPQLWGQGLALHAVAASLDTGAPGGAG